MLLMSFEHIVRTCKPCLLCTPYHLKSVLQKVPFSVHQVMITAEKIHFIFHTSFHAFVFFPAYIFFVIVKTLTHAEKVFKRQLRKS